MADKDFDGKTALITGGASGLGQAAARLLAGRGAKVLIADLNEAGGAETVRQCEAAGSEAAFVPTDVTKEEDVKAAVGEVVSRWGRLDAALNNAGTTGAAKPTADYTVEEWSFVIALNLTSVFLCLKHEIPQMVSQGGGAIVNTSSNAGLRGVHLIGAYAASKHGILGLTKNGAIEYADEGIRVNAVCPGAIMTPLMSDQPPERQQEILAPQAMSRFGEPAEVAAAVVWLCSDDASFVTGVALPVDAGSVAGW